MISGYELAALLLIALLGHAMALIWWRADQRGLFEQRIYSLSVTREQLRRELKNSIYMPLHSLILLGFLAVGFFQNTSVASFLVSLVMAYVWAEIWHYVSHRAMHTRRLHWIHKEHHKSRLCSPFTALSFSLTEKLVFSLGIVGLLAVADVFYSMNFYGIATWFVGYLVINSFGHGNFEIKAKGFVGRAGRLITSTTYHSLHHARYVKNYGLGTRVLDRVLDTEWEDYREIFTQVTDERQPMTQFKEKLQPA